MPASPCASSAPLSTSSPIASVEYLDFEDALLAVEEARAEAQGTDVRVPPYRLDECDRGIIESALFAPRTSWEGKEKYPDLAAKAAALLYALAKIQACPEGNKRVALILVVEFLARNGATLEISSDELADMILATAETDPVDRDDVVAGLTQRLRPLTEPLTEDL